MTTTLITFKLSLGRLRPWREGDEDSLSHHASNRRIWNNVRDFFPYPYTPRDAHSWVRSNKSYQQPNNLAIEIDGQAVGNIGFTVKDDIYRYNAEIGYWLSEEYWGRGIMSEAVPIVTEYIFTQKYDSSRTGRMAEIMCNNNYNNVYYVFKIF